VWVWSELGLDDVVANRAKSGIASVDGAKEKRETWGDAAKVGKQGQLLSGERCVEGFKAGVGFR
jgi:hypothetical protein